MSDPCVLELIEAQVRRSPAAVAAVGEDRELTYGELDDWADRIAGCLQTHNVTSEFAVAVCLPRGLGLLAGLLGIWKAGGHYVPLDPELPPARLAQLIADAGAHVVLTDASLASRVAAAARGAPVVCLQTAGGRRTVGRRAGPENLAYTMFTSGSTGRPKGVQVEHRGLLNRLLWAQDRYQLTGGDVVLHKTPYSFDVSVWELFWPLMVGARLVVAAPGEHRSPAAIAALIDRHGVTVAHFVPSMLDQFLTGRTGGCPSLTRVLVSGEALTGQLGRRFFDAFPAVALHNLYGPTEASIDVTAWQCRPDADPNAPVPIGHPIANTHIHVLDADLKPLPADTIGEIYIAGVGLARGYHNQPGQTADRFVPNPFSDEPANRLYRTGDLGRRSPDGTMHYHGRVDREIKVRGVRIHPAEIETAILTHPAVKQAIVRPGDDAATLVAVLVPQTTSAPSSSEIRAHLRGLLPEHLIPTAFLTLTALPLTANGKVDHHALPRSDGRRPPVDTPYAAPETPTQQAIAAMWAEVLGIRLVGKHDNFFELGGHSLAANAVITRLRRTLGVEVALRTIFEHPTVAQLSRVIEGAALSEASARIRPTGSAGPFPLSFPQRRLWFLAQLKPGSADYNVPIALRLSGQLDQACLQQALDALVARQRVLRTVFPAPDGDPHQVVLDRVTCPIELTHVPGDADERDRRLGALAADEVARPFDLDRGPLLRARLFHLDSTDHVLVLTTHHITIDVQSVDLLLTELAALYNAARADTDADLPDLLVHYADYAVWQRRTAKARAGRAHWDFWRTELSGVPPLELPTDRRRPRMPATGGSTHGFDLDETLTAAVRDVAHRLGATTNIVTLAVFALLLSRYSGQTDFAIGSPFVAREDQDLERIIGCFMNTVVLRADLSGDPTFAELIQRIRNTTLNALDNASVPFELVVDDLVVDRDTSRSPLFQVAFTHQRDTDRARQGFHGLAVAPYSVRQGTSKFELTLTIAETDRSIRGSWEYRTDLFDRATVSRLIEHFTVLLTAMVTDPHQRAYAPALTGPPAIGQHPAPPAACAHELVEQQSDRSPDEIAVVDGDTALSYRELDERANQVAHWLIGRGFGAPTLVGLNPGAGTATMVGLLGILKAGAVCVPLDPAPTRVPVAVMVAERSTVGHVDGAEARRRLCLNDEGLRAQPVTRPRVPVCPDQLAFVLGPTAVEIDHSAVTARIRAAEATAPLRSSDVVLPARLSDALWPLVAGARLVSASCVDADAVARHGVTVVDLPPRRLDRVRDCPSLRLIRLGGEPAHQTTIDRFTATAGAELHQIYGHAEVGPVTWWRCGPAADPLATVPIGSAVPRALVVVLDRELNHAPIGVAGEIYVGGPGLARGYAGQPALTARRFVPDPDGEARLFRTGDRGRRRADGAIELVGEASAEAELMRHPGVEAAAVVVRMDHRVAAYVVTRGDQVTAAQLREHLRSSLPESLVPTDIVRCPDLPLTTDGRLDRARLSEPPATAEATAAPVAAATPTESLLARIWMDVLGLAHVSVHDNFFELGGDSILGMQVVSRIRNEGLWLVPSDIFDAQTIAELARVVSTAPAIVATQEPVVGPVRMTPIQHAFFDRLDDRPGRHSQVVAVPVPADLSDDGVRTGLTQILTQHDALRTRFRAYGGVWSADIVEPTPAELQIVPLADADLVRATGFAVAETTTLDGPLARGVLLVFPDGSRQLLLVIHHLVVDMVSWSIILDDLRHVLSKLASGRPPTLPPKTTPYQYWAQRLADYAGSAAAPVDAGYWLADNAPPPLPVDHSIGLNSAESARTVTVECDEVVTAALLSGAVPRWHGASPMEVMVAALTMAVTGWTRAGAVRIDLESHGRDDVFDEVDLSRTVGWFTNVYPVWLRPAAGLGETIRAVREELRRTPKHGLAYGAARYLAPDERLRTRLAAGSADIVFNYLGGGEFAGSGSDARPIHFGRSGSRSHLLSIVGRVDRGRLRFDWEYSANRHQASTVQDVSSAFVRHVREFVDDCVRLDAAGHAPPAHYPLADLTQSQLDQLAGPGVQDVYPLTPMQHGMVFHSLASPSTGMYLSQLNFQLDGEFSERLFRQAMETVIARHPILRTSIEWQRLRTPHQIVHDRVALPYRFEDRSADGPAFDLGPWMAAERKAEFEFSTPPLLRLSIIRLAAQSHHAILTSHHSILDGWSGSLFLQECWDTYFTLTTGRVPLASSRPAFRDYVAWIARQDPAKAEDFWRGLLEHVREPTPFPDRPVSTGGDIEVVRGRLPHEVSAALSTYTRQHRLTLSAVAYAAWAIVLSRVTAHRDVVFGATLSGRTAPLPELHQMIGIFANTLPLRLRLPDDGDPLPFLRAVQAQLVGVSRFEYTPLARVQRLARLRPGASLFSTVVLVQNFPVFLGKPASADNPLAVRRGPSTGRTNFPVVVEVLPTTPLTVRIQFDTSVVDRALAAHLVATMTQAITGLIEHDPAVWRPAPAAGEMLTW